MKMVCGCHDHDMFTQGVNEAMCKKPTLKGVNVKSPNSQNKKISSN